MVLALLKRSSRWLKFMLSVLLGNLLPAEKLKPISWVLVPLLCRYFASVGFGGGHALKFVKVFFAQEKFVHCLI
jgi:hypothetical protein